MASTIHQKPLMDGVLKALILCIKERRKLSSLVEEGHTYWHIASAIEIGTDMKLIIRNKGDFILTEEGIKAAICINREVRPFPLPPLDQFRIDRSESAPKIVPGRRALEQIRKRVRD